LPSGGHPCRRKSLVDAGTGEVTVAKAYRLLKAILNTAVDDGLIRRNPCRIKGAGQERSPERPVLTIRQAFGLADAIDQRYRALILLAVFGSLRWGELAALRQRHIDPATGTLRVEVSVVELVDGSLVTGPPKSTAGKRIVFLPHSCYRRSSRTWSDSRRLARTASCLPGRRMAHCADPTSAAFGSALPSLPG
jgi:integrase